jgi:hypothetical protein
VTARGSAGLLLLALTTFVLFLSTLVGTPVIPELTAELGADAGATATILSASLMTVVALQFFTGGVADRYGRRLVLGGANFLLGLVMAADVTPEEDAARMLGAFDAAVDLLMLVAPLAALALHRQLERVSPLLLGAGSLSLLAFPVALAVQETQGAPETGQGTGQAAAWGKDRGP